MVTIDIILEMELNALWCTMWKDGWKGAQQYIWSDKYQVNP